MQCSGMFIISFDLSLGVVFAAGNKPLNRRGHKGSEQDKRDKRVGDRERKAEELFEHSDPMAGKVTDSAAQRTINGGRL